MSVLALPVAKIHLNITGDGVDEELQEVIDSAEASIAELCGPLTSVEKTERVRGGCRGLVLRHTPVVSITSVTPVGGSAYADVSDAVLDVDLSAGVIEWNSGALWPSGRYDVVYQAGRSSVPEDLMMGVKELVRHLWAPQRGAHTRRPGTAPDEPAQDGSLIPARVLRRIRPHIQIGN